MSAAPKGAEIEAGDVGLGVLLEVELAALPGDGGEDSAAGGGEAGRVVADEELEAAEAALLEALEKVAPVDFGFAEGDAGTEDLALAIGAGPQLPCGSGCARLATLAIASPLPQGSWALR